MRMTTLCYIEKDGNYLMLHRIKKKADMNKDKWLGVGGGMEDGESPEECIMREVKEETGLTLLEVKFRGFITFVSEEYGTEYMCLFTSTKFEGEMIECNEGTLEWVKKEDVYSLNLWEGDKLMFRLLEARKDFFTLKLEYENDQLVGASVDNKPCEFFDLLDEKGMPTGMVKERTLAHREGASHRTVHIWIVRENREGSFDILLQKRCEKKDSYPGCYDISSAGHVKAGEDVLSSALRELKEELGIVATKDDLKYAFQQEVLDQAEFYGSKFTDHEFGAVYIYQKPVDIDYLRLDKEEVEAVTWMKFEDCYTSVLAKDPSYCLNIIELRRLKVTMDQFICHRNYE